jgi:hypothetical protein
VAPVNGDFFEFISLLCFRLAWWSKAFGFERKVEVA